MSNRDGRSIRTASEERLIPMRVVTAKGKDRLAEEANKLAELIPVFAQKRIRQVR